MIFKGKCVCPGVAEGQIHLVEAGSWLAAALGRESIQTPEAELGRLDEARARAAVELSSLQRLLTERGRTHDAQIFAAHATLLGDQKLLDRIEHEIRSNLQSAEAAVARIAIEVHNMLKDSGLPILRDKAADVLDVGQRMVRCLDERTVAKMPQADIVLAASVVPSDLVRYVHHGVAAIITETCGAKSHTAILARGLGIPMITGIDRATKRIRDGARVVLDAGGGIVIVDPTEADDDAVRQIRGTKSASVFPGSAVVPKTTADGVPISVLLNISDPIEAENAGAAGIAGVGLFRTEFLYMDRNNWPTEDENFRAYEQVAASIGDGELDIRLADFGAEKCPPYADIPVNRNPSLGIRGVRLLLTRPDILEPQIHALARLARQRPLVVLIPMIDTLDTLFLIRGQLRRMCGVGEQDPLPFRLGAMIEIPAAAVQIDEMIREVDAISIGLNDLTQYLLAADRDDETVEPYHDALQPVVLRIVRRLVEVADAHGKPVTMCGEMAGDSRLTALLLALGVRRFSVSRSQATRIGNVLGGLSATDLAPFGVAILECKRGSEVRALLQERGMLP
jgi:phosphotransferase system enzyme I (PtsI)